MPCQTATITTMSNPFTDPVSIAYGQALTRRRRRREHGFVRDLRRLEAITSGASPHGASPQSARILAYCVLIRCLTLASDTITDVHTAELDASFRKMVERAEQGGNRLAALKAHVATAVETTEVAEVDPALPAVWAALEAFMQEIVREHWAELTRFFDWAPEIVYSFRRVQPVMRHMREKVLRPDPA